MELKGTKTEQNLITAFAGESQARNKYLMFAGSAKKEGFEQIAAIFQATADNEFAHAKMWLKELSGIKTTKENLAVAAAGENSEWKQMYPEFAQIAKEEGFERIAKLFSYVADIEKEHEERFVRALENVEQNKVFTKDSKTVWICRNCGHIYEGTSAPEVCPVCAHPKAYFEVFKQLP
ncbi:MAG: rubrerythrin family protein [Clostridia bacterium]|nr:rubrerythrin family protein [Clostridia bacterium]